MRPSLFQRGLVPRLIASAAYGLAAFGTVALLAPTPPGQAARTTEETTTSSAPASPAARRATLCLESLLPVAAWEVRVDGALMSPRRSDATTWIAEAALATESALVIDAAPEAGGPARRNALRIRIAGTPVSRDQTFWCERDWSLAAQAGRLAPAPAPLDPEDLP